MSFRKIINIFLLIILTCNINAQGFKIMSVPNTISVKYRHFYSKPEGVKFIYIEDYLPKYYNKTASVDYTSNIQYLLNKYKNVVFPNFPLKINQNGLLIPSNSILYFDKGSELIFSGPANSRKSDILKLYNSMNVRIYNPTIKGSRYIKKEQWGEWSAGIALLNASEVEIYNVKISNTFGDGIIFADQSKNVKVIGGWIDQARRDGISITSGINIYIKDLLISNTYGTLPECGIQIEPDFPSDNLNNIEIRNITGFNNANCTLNFNIGPLNQNERKYNKSVIIIADSIEDYHSTRTLGFVMNADNKKNTPKGEIIIKNVKSYSSKYFLWKDNGKSNIRIIYNNLKDKDNKEVTIR
jgi:hypothetical protein